MHVADLDAQSAPLRGVQPLWRLQERAAGPSGDHHQSNKEGRLYQVFKFRELINLRIARVEDFSI